MNLKHLDTEAKALREVKKRIRTLLREPGESRCGVAGYIANGVHEIRFDIKTKNGYLSGVVGIAAS